MGGCAMNSLANGKIFSQTPFKEVFIQPAAGDAGGAIGAAYHIYNQVLGNQRSFILEQSYLGPEFSDEEIGDVLEVRGVELRSAKCTIELIADENELC